jgi:putative hydrolase
MAEERQPGSDDQPEDESQPGPESSGDVSKPSSSGSQGWVLGGGLGSGSAGSGSGSSSSGSGAGENPLEAFFSSLAGGDMNALMQQMQSAFAMLGGAGSIFAGPSSGSGSGVNWSVTKDTARKTVASLGPDPTPDAAQRRALTEAASIAEVWLDEATAFPRVSASVSAWSRADWIENTMPVWQRLVEPVAAHIADAMEGALNFGGEETAAMPGLAGMKQMLRTSGASMFGLQLGQGLGQLATEVVGATDIGLPLSEPGKMALLPTNLKAFGEGLEQSSTDVTLYLALRESARQRLFTAAPWLREQMLALVEQYAAGITIDTSALEQAVSQLDPSNLEDLSGTLEGGLFEPQKTPAQLATLERLETMLALVEGWVDEVVSQATAKWMPAATALAETVRRARASGGPAEATFATLVGLELRPRRMRDAANLWAAVRAARGVEGRDAIWSHPDLLPRSTDLDDPLGFVASEGKADASDESFDAALAELLDEADSEANEKPASDDHDQPDDHDRRADS